MTFDFLGKDLIRYYNKVTVDEQVFKNIKIFRRDKVPEAEKLCVRRVEEHEEQCKAREKEDCQGRCEARGGGKARAG